MVKFVSPLDEFIEYGHHGAQMPNGAGVVLTEIKERHLIQLGFWEESFDKICPQIMQAFQFKLIPNPLMAQNFGDCFWMLPEPLKFWLDIDDMQKAMKALRGLATEMMSPLDITDGKWIVDMHGDKVQPLFQRLFAVDLSENAMPEGHFKALNLHHAPVHLLRMPNLLQMANYRLYLPRSFAVFLCEVIIHSAEQYGVELR